MHSEWTRKSRAWGCEVIRALEMDDPLRVIRAFRYPSGMIFVDLNTQVEGDYGGYAWTEMMHLYFGDTALHIALKWKRHRAVKALLSLRPDWTIPNESGSTAEDLTLRVYGKDIATLKGEQEREYENDAMWGEEDAMRRLEVAEQNAREWARLKFLRELHATRTMGVKGEAKLLLGCDRVLAKDALENDRRAATSRGITAGRWTAHICHELRRNRFAALHGATHKRMEAPLVPVASASSSPLLSPSATQSIRGRSAGDLKRNKNSGAASGAVEGKTDTGAGGHESLERELRARVVIRPPRLGVGWPQMSPLLASMVTIRRSALRALLNPALRSLRLRSSVLGKITPRNSPTRRIQTKIIGHTFMFESRMQHRLLEDCVEKRTMNDFLERRGRKQLVASDMNAK